METGVLDAYLLWECSRKTVEETLSHSPIDRNRMLTSMERCKEQINELSVEVKMDVVKSHSPFRADRIKTKHWMLEDYPVARLGLVLPYMGDLPIEEIVKSFVEVAGYVKRQVEIGSSLKSIEYIRSMSRISDILEKIPVMVIEPGSEQRRPDVLKQVGRSDLPVYPAHGYLEDGNHRALALMLSNPQRKTILSWVGR
ncbi:MAG: hypothetical protein ACLPY5_02645 [Candidatus Bathyarchaeia archaeon]